MSTSIYRALRATLATMIATMLFTVLPGLTGIASAETVCPNAAFRNGPSANLPDCRAYELVTPLYKNGGELGNEDTELGSTGESALVRSRSVPLPRTTGDIDGAYSLYTLTRTAEGWTPTAIQPPATEYEGYFHGFSAIQPDIWGSSPNGLSTLWVTRRRSDPEPDRRVDGLYLERTPGAPLVEVGPMAPPSWPPSKAEIPFEPKVIEPESEELGTMKIVDYSKDLSHILLGENESDNVLGDSNRREAEETLLGELTEKDQWSSAETAEADPRLYEYIGTGNKEPLPVGIGNNGKVISECGTQLSQRSPYTERHASSSVYGEVNGDNPISADGRTVFFIARAKGTSFERRPSQPCNSSLKVNELYARVDNGESGAHTVAISEPSAADCSACDTERIAQEPAYFQGASEDGSKVFFTTEQSLLGEDGTRNIYEYDFDAQPGERIVKVSGGDSTISKEPEAHVDGVSAISADGSHVYFVAGGVLTLTLNSQGQQAIEGADNLYVFDTETRATSFIADLCSGRLGEKEKSGTAKDASCRTEIKRSEVAAGGISGKDSILWGSIEAAEENEGEGTQTPTNVDVTPDGQFLVFTSYADLTPDDTSVGPTQAFEYDAQTGVLVRVSIGENGFNDNGNSDNPYLGPSIVSPLFGIDPSNVGGATNGDNRISVSANGSYVFFDSADGLTPRALNGVVLAYVECGAVVFCEAFPEYANNVYEYHDDQIYLISDGKDLSIPPADLSGAPNVHLVGTDQSGRDVLFTTDDALVSSDTDEGPDVYDARIDGGFSEPEVRPQCSGDECQGPLSGAPVLLSPGSEFQAGGSNFKPSVNAPVSSKAKKPKAKAKKKSKDKRKSKHKVKLSAGRREGRRK